MEHSSAAMAMACSVAERRRARERTEREGGVGHRWCSILEEQGHEVAHGLEVVRMAAMVGRAPAWLQRTPPLRSFPEHLAGDDVATLELSFGHLWGIFGSRRLMQSSCSLSPLQLSLRLTGH